MGIRDELREMARGFRWGHRPIVPRSAEPFREEREDGGFPTDWARTEAGTLVRQAIMNGPMTAILRSELSLRVHGLDHLDGVRGPVLFFSNHSSHLDATLILATLPDRWQRKTAVGAARDYFFDVWWRQAFTALVYAGFPIDRAKGGQGATHKARELVRDGWSIVVFPEGTRSADGHVQRFRHGSARLCLELGIPAAPVAIVGAYQAMPRGRLWPRAGRPTVTVRYGAPIVPAEGESHQDVSRRMAQAIAELFDEDRTTWWGSLGRAERGETPSLAGPQGPDWLRRWEGSRPLPRRGDPPAWD